MIDQTDHAIKNMLDDMHAGLKNGPVRPLPRGVDHARPPLDYGPGTPLAIKPLSASHKRLTIHGQPK